MTPPLSGIPHSFTAGDTVIFTEPGGQYPSNLWTMTLWLSLIGGTGIPTSVVATASGLDYLITISAAASAAIAAGSYRYTEIVTGGSSESYTVKEGTLSVLPNFATAQAPSLAQQQVTKIQASIAKLNSQLSTSRNFNGQSSTDRDLKQFQEQLTFWQAQVIKEQAAIDRLRGGKDSGRVQPRFEPTYQNYPPFGFPGNVSL